MSKKFNTEEYVSRWDDKLIPIMLVVIIASMIGVYAMNVMLRPACTTHDYVFCGTPLDQPSEEGHHGAPEGAHAPADHGHEESGHAPAGHDHQEGEGSQAPAPAPHGEEGQAPDAAHQE